MRRTILSGTLLLSFIVLLGLGALLYMKTAMHGFSARARPSAMETWLAGYARDTAMPTSAKRLPNPVTKSPELLHEAMAHFADHCAVCHANNGSGETMFGNGMYPKPCDLRQSRTQNMTDGEIFYIIENGIRMSGMPAFGGTDTATDSWKLVHFIRHLPLLTSLEESQMESLNPKTSRELQEASDEDRFLNGSDSAIKAVPQGKEDKR